MFFHFGSTGSAMGLKICAITAEVQKYNSKLRKKKKHDKRLSLGKPKLKSA